MLETKIINKIILNANCNEKKKENSESLKQSPIVLQPEESGTVTSV